MFSGHQLRLGKFILIFPSSERYFLIELCCNVAHIFSGTGNLITIYVLCYYSHVSRFGKHCVNRKEAFNIIIDIFFGLINLWNLVRHQSSIFITRPLCLCISTIFLMHWRLVIFCVSNESFILTFIWTCNKFKIEKKIWTW